MYAFIGFILFKPVFASSEQTVLKRGGQKNRKRICLRFASFQSKEKNYEVMRWKNRNFLRQFSDVRRQTRFVARGGVFVQNSFVDRFINWRNGRV